MRFALKKVLSAVAVTVLSAGAAAAADLGAAPAPVADASIEAFKNFQIKAGVTTIIWDDHNNGIFAGATKLNGSAHATDIVLPTLTLTYFFDKHWAAELFCCFAHARVKADGGLSGLGTVADTWAFPPILTAQYHFDRIGNIRPYVGAGVEYIHYFKSQADGGLAGTNVKFRDSWGPAVQAGFDMELGSGWSLGFDAKYVWEDTRITWSNGVTTKHDLDPLLLTANIGYRFSLDDLFSRRAAAPVPLK